ncbi:M15 family metallopeptidase [Saccharibacillus kuerlensis]|uniref:D-alanyl-D-alanine carboxypeptidase-like core domain-containing protein n=1 Tax=Saccharibacillus kuerlensis TaxID=459527 RepID=A0ABQ2KW89_9BACL|nr:M15 family metallopeptidase [Saccharibacillus kuerlensis]GGN94759.1 hypothetical protein GCM10010969_09760 [Saccharibacillus kuerlensis]
MKSGMKRWGVITVIVALLVAAAVFKLADQRSVLGDHYELADGLIQEIALRNSREALRVTEEERYEGDLLLVNSDYPARPQGTKPDIVELFGHPELTGRAALLDSSIRLSRSVALKFVVMLDAAAADGVEHFLISSGYRDQAEQGQLYKEKGADYALPPGRSEHQLGLALDVGSTEGKMGEADEGKWLEENAARYGFVLRYPADKTEITGISFEPWHFRYVGLPHSVLMKKTIWYWKSMWSCWRRKRRSRLPSAAANTRSAIMDRMNSRSLKYLKTAITPSRAIIAAV